MRARNHFTQFTLFPKSFHTIYTITVLFRKCSLSTFETRTYQEVIRTKVQIFITLALERLLSFPKGSPQWLNIEICFDITESCFEYPCNICVFSESVSRKWHLICPIIIPRVSFHRLLLKMLSGCHKSNLYFDF